MFTYNTSESTMALPIRLQHKVLYMCTLTVRPATRQLPLPGDMGVKTGL